MKPVIGAVAYLSVVVGVVASAFLVVASVDLPRTTDASAAAKQETGAASLRQAYEQPKEDPNRVPVWIAPTTKYDYAPVAVTAQRPKQSRIIGAEVRARQNNATEKAFRGAAPRAIQAALHEDRYERSSMRMGFSGDRRDNDPFYRD